jgi:hypothetical protein
MATDLEGHRRAVRIADIDPQTVLNVDGRHAAIVDIQPIEAAVVDGDPSALIESHHQVSPGDQGMRDTHVGPQIAPDDDIVARCKGAFGTLVAHGQHGRGWSAHEANCIGIRGLSGTAGRYGLPAQAKSHAICPPVFEGRVAGNPRSMPDTASRFPDDVPVADAIEQHRPTGESASDDQEDVTSRLVEDEVPLEATDSDWQEQQQPALIGPEFGDRE